MFSYMSSPRNVHRDREVSKEERYWLWERGKVILNIGKPVELLVDPSELISD